MGSGGKGGSTSTSVEIPAWLQDAAQGNLAKANEISKIGYTPYYGPDVAAMTPMQEAAMANTNMGASAFGMSSPSSPTAGMPAVQTFANGMQGYSSGGLYDQARAELAARNPGQFAAMNAPFINPQTGAQPSAPYGTGGGSAAAASATEPVKELTYQQKQMAARRAAAERNFLTRDGSSDR